MTKSYDLFKKLHVKYRLKFLNPKPINLIFFWLVYRCDPQHGQGKGLRERNPLKKTGAKTWRWELFKVRTLIFLFFNIKKEREQYSTSLIIEYLKNK